MNQYIKHLIEDIHKASWNIRPPHELWLDSKADPDYDLELEDISYAEKYIYGKEIPIEEITGIAKVQLPSPERLTEQQRGVLAVELEKLLEVFHFKLIFPDLLPSSMRYSFIRDFWEESEVPLSFGENEIEFCDMEEEECPFPGYCDVCKEVAEQMRMDEEHEFNASACDFDVKDLLPSTEELENFIREKRKLMGEDPLEELIFDLNEDGEEEEEEEEKPFVGGFFDDDGNRMDQRLIPVPGKCVICKLYHDEDWDENLLCQMTRYDQRNKSKFECGAFELE